MSWDRKVQSANGLNMALYLVYWQLPNVLRTHYNADKQNILFGSLEHY